MCINIGLCITGSFCTFKKTLEMAKKLVEHGYNLTAILSYNAATIDTRFYAAKDFLEQIKQVTGKDVITEISTAEPVGTKKLFDICLVAPTTGNTLAKINYAITDTPVTMCVKAHLRNNRPVVIFVSTNDGLAANAQNIGQLLNRKHVYFVPFGQDDAKEKPNSLISDFDSVIPTIKLALQEKQLQPVLLR